MNRRLYVYTQKSVEEIAVVFSSLSDTIQLEYQDESLLVLNDHDYYNEEPMDLEEFYILLVQDFEMPITMVVEPYTNSDFPLGELIQRFIAELPAKMLDFEDLIVYAVLYKNDVFKKAIIQYIQSLVNADVIHTVREFINNSMNSSVSAKKLYMHRNTLNYRIDNFIDATTINVKTFKGANAIYMLYQF